LPSQMQLLVSALGTFQTLAGLPKGDWFVMICCLPLLAYRILQTDSGLDRLDSRICAAALHGGCSRMFSRMFKSDIEWTDVNWFLLFSFHHRVSGCFWFWSFLICVDIIWAVMEWCWT
jgi:hypothetical protein